MNVPNMLIQCPNKNKALSPIIYSSLSSLHLTHVEIRYALSISIYSIEESYQNTSAVIFFCP